MGATEEGWEGVGGGAFEAAAELDVTAAIELFPEGKVKLDLSGNREGGIATIPSIQLQVPERHTAIKCRIKPRSTRDQRTESTTKGHFIGQTDGDRNRRPWMGKKLPDS
jgi:hypothetical protein